MWEIITGKTFELKRCLYIVLCSAYILTITLPTAITSAQEASTGPETTASEMSTEAPAPEPVPAPPTTTEPVNPENPAPVTPPSPETENKYVYNPETGKWENGKYTWDPSTRQSAPVNQPSYSYNPETKQWDTEKWVYSTEDSRYIAQTQVKPQPIAESIVLKTNSSDELPQSLSINQNNETPKLSISQPDNSNYFDLFFNAEISTTHSSHAVSGNANVLQNTVAGNAISGNALAIANIINMVQSVWGWQGLTPELFTADIQGDYYGDILINPAHLGLADNNCGCQDLVVNGTVNGSIENDVDLLAKSGDVTVAKNTSAGNAQSGDATAIASIINMINSSMAAGQSFIGNINIHGSLEGDILMPENLLDTLIASDIPSVQMDLSNSDINLESNTFIDNNVNASANSGQADVNNNTTAGSAVSGDAKTNVTIFNLTNRSVVGTNALLVFVNVAGEWVGFITDAPAGATVAMLGGGITENSCQTCGGTASDINLESNAKITNNINVSSQSGDASVNHNTSAGDAITGSAVAMANIANLTSANVSMSGWLGVLFINILDNWLGSFGTDTLYGNTPEQAETPQTPAVITDNNSLRSNSYAYVQPQKNQAASTPRPEIRAYEVSFSDDKEGKIVLASVNQVDPPITKALGASTLNPSNSTDMMMVGAAVLLTAGAIAGIVYRTKLQFLVGRLLES